MGTSAIPPAGRALPAARLSLRPRAQRLLATPELFAVLIATAALNLVNLRADGWANTYYSAAVRSMAASWHNFLYAAMDPAGLMTVDKPPLALWVQALSVRVFGWHPLAILVPQALMGIAAVWLTYDLVRARYGRVAATIGAFTLAATPIVVAVSRHNNPDELLVLCAVAALWNLLRGLERGRVRSLVWTGVWVGLGFETKMAAALIIVPGLALAWLWVAPHGRMRALRELLLGGAAMVLVAGAWPALVTLTPAADRPWISGTSDNSVWSLIFGYNGLGRVAGQTGGPAGLAGRAGAAGAGGGFPVPGGGFPGPGGGFPGNLHGLPGGPGGGGPGGGVFGGNSGITRLLNDALGPQASWLLGLAIFAGLLLLVRTRLRRPDPRTGLLLAVGGGLATTAVTFSFAQGIFHPYYVSLMAPFVAILVGAGIAEVLRGPWDRSGRALAAGALLAGLAVELVVLGTISGDLGWAAPVTVAGIAVCLGVIALPRVASLRTAAVLAGVAALLLAPTVYATQTDGHSLSSTFPAGGPASAEPSAPGSGPRRLPGLPILPGGGFPPGMPPGAPMFGAGGGFSARGFTGPPGFGEDSGALTAAIRYATSHGGGTIAVESQSSAASAIVASHADIAGIGGFSGRESTVSVSWLADAVAAGRLRWVIGGASSHAALPGDTRTGSRTAFSAAAKACRAVPLSGATLYDCAGRSAALRRTA